MNFSSAVFFICCVFFQRIPQVSCAGDLDNADYIAIAVSVGLTAFIVLVMGYLLWRARNRSAMGTNNIMGQDNPAVTPDNVETGEVRGISLTPLPFQALQEPSVDTINA
ncbi:hypothetical protein OS493_004897 [Desmophyllum pertusum]|uniref:Uncharacterized protein n=1 Tax=Desmophyllum pertusum TaxID=174260 RepID=A0A9W9Z719_9CNID|nr:hypothetical protein OS493_004897 [Desmophyllum pertusum]